MGRGRIDIYNETVRKIKAEIIQTNDQCTSHPSKHDSGIKVHLFVFKVHLFVQMSALVKDST